MSFTKKKFFTRITICLLPLILLSSCFQSLSPRSEKGSVIIHIAVPSSPSVTDTNSDVRFIHPDTKKVILTVTAPDMETVTETKNLSSEKSEIVIEVNTIPSGINRKIHIALYDSGTNLFAEGSTTSNIEANIQNPISITAIPVDAISLEVGIASDPIPSSMKGKTLVYSVNVVTNGPYDPISNLTLSYPIVFNVYDSVGKKVSAPEEVRHYFELQTGTYFLTATLPLEYEGDATIALNLAQPPIAPENFKITGFDGMKITLAWDANTNVVESYELFDGIESKTLSAGTLTNLISPPASIATLRIKAVNKYGSSSEATLNYVAPTDITLDRTTLVLGVDKSTTLIATVVPNEASLASYINWTSDQENLATVESNGIVTGIESNLISPVVLSVSFPSSIASVSSSAVLTVVETGFADGSGTKADPYLVTTAADLDLVRYAQTAFYSQTEPISFSPQTEWNPIGTAFAPFMGTYNGNGKHITGLYVSNAAFGPTGLFGATENSTLREVSLINVNFNNNEASTPSSGALVGSAKNTTIFRCFSTGDTSLSLGNNVGGLVGSATGGSISESWSSASVYGDSTLGGLIGISSDSQIINSYAIGSVNGWGDEYNYSAGLVGSATGGTITNCFAAGQLNDSFNGLVGAPADGGLSPNVTSSYWDMYNCQTGESFGGGTGIESPELMMQKATFDGWDFTTVWAINEGKTYPYLKNVGIPVIAVEGKSSYGESTPSTLYTNDSINCGYFNNTGTFNDIEFTLYNNGTSSLNPVITLSNTTIDAYSLLPPSGDPVSPILPGDSYPFTVRFTYIYGHGAPTVLGELTILSDDPDTPNFVLSLTGSFSD